MPTLIVFLMALTLLQSPATSSDLLEAIRYGNHAEVQRLLEAGIDVNTVDADGTSALMHAVLESDAALMKLLIERDAKVNAQNSAGSTALMYAATNLDKARI